MNGTREVTFIVVRQWHDVVVGGDYGDRFPELVVDATAVLNGLRV